MLLELILGSIGISNRSALSKTSRENLMLSHVYSHCVIITDYLNCQCQWMSERLRESRSFCVDDLQWIWNYHKALRNLKTYMRFCLFWNQTCSLNRFLAFCANTARVLVVFCRNIDVSFQTSTNELQNIFLIWDDEEINIPYSHYIEQFQHKYMDRDCEVDVQGLIVMISVCCSYFHLRIG